MISLLGAVGGVIGVAGHLADVRKELKEIEAHAIAEGERRIKESQDYINSEAWCENELEEAREEGYNEAVDNLGKDLMEGKGKCDEALMKLIESQKEKYRAEGERRERERTLDQVKNIREHFIIEQKEIRQQALKEVQSIIEEMLKDPDYFIPPELIQAIDQLRNKGE